MGVGIEKSHLIEPADKGYGGFLAKAAQSREQIEEECPILLLLPYDLPP